MLYFVPYLSLDIFIVPCGASRFKREVLAGVHALFDALWVDRVESVGVVCLVESALVGLGLVPGLGPLLGSLVSPEDRLFWLLGLRKAGALFFALPSVHSCILDLAVVVEFTLVEVLVHEHVGVVGGRADSD